MTRSLIHTCAQFSWSDCQKRGGRSDRFALSYPGTSRKPGTFKEEVEYSLQQIYDAHQMPFAVMFSGGMDSEVIVRSLHQLQLPFQAYFFEYKLGLWKEKNRVQEVAKELGIDVKSIFFDEDKFLSGEIFEIAAEYQIPEPFAAFDIKRAMMVEGLPIFGTGDLLLEQLPEGGIVSTEYASLFLPHLYFEKEKRPGCFHFYQSTPELMLSFLQDHHIQTWIKMAPEFGFEDVRYFKAYLYKKYWPTMVIQPKFTGYERLAPQYFKVQDQLQELYGHQDQAPIKLEDLLTQLIVFK